MRVCLSKEIAAALTSKMQIGYKYRVSELILLLEESNYVFSKHSLTPNKSENHRPRWNRWVRNSLRNSPDRNDHPTNWWAGLHAEWVGPKVSDWEYWITENSIYELASSLSANQ